MKGLKRGLLLSLLSGIIMSLASFPMGEFSVSFLCFIALVPLLFAFEEQKKFLHILACAWLAVLVQSLISFQWVYFVAREFGSLTKVTSFFILLGFSLLTNFYLQIFAVLYYLFRRRLVGKPKWTWYILILPSLYMLSELVDPRVFNWSIGDALSSYRYMFQFADVFGVQGLAFLCIAANASIYMIIKRMYLRIAIPIAIFVPVFLLTYGYFSYRSIKHYQEACPSINAGVVQANIGNPIMLNIGEVAKLRSELGVMDGEYASDASLVLGKYNSMSAKLIEEHQDLDVIIWPETAFPGYYNDGNPKMRLHRKFVNELGVPFLIGGYYFEFSNKGEKYYNSAILTGPNGELEYYHKHVLLPFGEYMPLGSIFPVLKDVVPAVGDFSSGTGPMIISVKLRDMDVGFAPTICYETLKPSYVREMIDKGANVILNMTNDSWFGTIEPHQHLRITRMRAVENRRPIIRSTNSGISTLIDMNGELINKSGLFTEENLKLKVPVCSSKNRSFYSMYGWMLHYVVGLLLLAWYVGGHSLKRKRK